MVQNDHLLEKIVANVVSGPAGKLLKLLDRHPYRPAHIHLIVSINFSFFVGNA